MQPSYAPWWSWRIVLACAWWQKGSKTAPCWICSLPSTATSHRDITFRARYRCNTLSSGCRKRKHALQGLLGPAYRTISRRAFLYKPDPYKLSRVGLLDSGDATSRRGPCGSTCLPDRVPAADEAHPWPSTQQARRAATRANPFQRRRVASQTTLLHECHPERERRISGRREILRSRSG